MRVTTANRAALRAIAEDGSGCSWAPRQRAQALLALDDRPAALACYAADPVDPRTAINDLINDEWVWCLPHVVNHAHLRLAAGDEHGREILGELLESAEAVLAQGVVSVDALYWMASAQAVMGEKELALQLLEQAVRQGWRHAWWARHDWNWAALAGDSRFHDLLARGERTA